MALQSLLRRRDRVCRRQSISGRVAVSGDGNGDGDGDGDAISEGSIWTGVKDWVYFTRLTRNLDHWRIDIDGPPWVEGSSYPASSILASQSIEEP